MSRSRGHKSSHSPLKAPWLAGIVCLSLIVLFSLVIDGTVAGWIYAVAVSLFPLFLLGLAGAPLRRFWRWWLLAMFTTPTLGLLVWSYFTLQQSDGGYRVTAWLLLAGFWMIPFLVTTVWYRISFRDRSASRAPASLRVESE